MNTILDEQLRELVNQSRQGDKQSYKRLLEQSTTVARTYCFKALKAFNRQEMTEDIIQEVLLTIHLKLHTYDEKLSFLAWLQVVTKHKLIDALRRCKVNHISLTDWEELEPVSQKDLTALIARHDLKKLLNKLKPPAGDIIYALKIEDVSLEKLASDYQTTVNNIKVIVHRGLQKLSSLIWI